MPLPLRRCALGLLLIAAASIAFGCGAPVVRNVVMISIDMLRADAVGAYGGPVPTPGLDRLAREGVTMQWAFAPTAHHGAVARDAVLGA